MVTLREGLTLVNLSGSTSKKQLFFCVPSLTCWRPDYFWQRSTQDSHNIFAKMGNNSTFVEGGGGSEKKPSHFKDKSVKIKTNRVNLKGNRFQFQSNRLTLKRNQVTIKRNNGHFKDVKSNRRLQLQINRSL